MAESTESVGASNKSLLRALAEGREAPEFTVEQFETVEFDRIKFSLFMAVVCESIPRRLGKDAESSLLTIDKRIARKVANVYRSLWMALDTDSVPDWKTKADRLTLAARAELGARRAGATVRWGAWLRTRYSDLLGLMGDVAAMALAKNRLRWGMRRIRLLDLERDNVRRIINEVVSRIERRKAAS